MKQKIYDIFVSYSRADIDIVRKLVDDIHANSNARCWVDWNGVESGDQFVDIIINAIDKVDTVLFILSDNSMASEFARKEIDYARNTGKKIVPVVADGGKLRGWFLFFFGSVDYIDIKVPMQYDKLLRNIGDWYGSTPVTHEILPAVEEETKSNPSLHSKESSKTYEIGDFYDENGKQGIVFNVTADGKHGKIVSLDQSCEPWAVYAVYVKVTGATSTGDGMDNMNRIKEQPDWDTNYPAFAWCASLGSGWYLPADDELRLIYEEKSIINRRLRERGYVGIIGDYWSSTEYSEFCAWSICVGSGNTGHRNKTYGTYVRAVSVF